MTSAYVVGAGSLRRLEWSRVTHVKVMFIKMWVGVVKWFGCMGCDWGGAVKWVVVAENRVFISINITFGAVNG